MIVQLVGVSQSSGLGESQLCCVLSKQWLNVADFSNVMDHHVHFATGRNLRTAIWQDLPQLFHHQATGH